MKSRKEWVKLPSKWIEEGGLSAFRWSARTGHANADNVAALMVLIVLAHHVDETDGVARLTYDELETLAGLSRAKLAKGLDLLGSRGVIERNLGRSVFKLAEFDPEKGWAKLPCRRLYSGNRVAAFDDFKLRKPAELNALKLYLLFAARRGRDTNLANLSYEKITEYAGISREHIKAALSLLAAHNLAHIERLPSTSNEIGVANAYRLVGLDSFNHMGTRGRGMDAAAMKGEFVNLVVS